MKLHITPEQFEQLIKRSYSLDVIYLLKLIDAKYDVKPLYEDSMRLSAIYQSLVRKGLITKDDEKITIIGKDLLKFVGEDNNQTKFVKKKPNATAFDEWWKLYPGTDTFTYQGRKFSGTRALRKDKQACKIKFNNILNEGDYTAEQLIEALKIEISQKVNMSMKTKQNRLTYMQNSLTYLNQRTFEAFIELIGEDTKPAEPTGSTDI
jgi:hypothetical protein|tara:strand:+ start:780 stop:1400 length:621 start_codon:yes stop_codon:yes gene_type:complete